MRVGDVTHIFAYVRKNIPLLAQWIEWNNSAMSQVIVDAFQTYGWSLESLLETKTAASAILKTYNQHIRPHEGPRDSESTLFDSSFSSQETSSSVYNNQGLIARSNPLLDLRNWTTRELTDPTAQNLSLVNISNENLVFEH